MPDLPRNIKAMLIPKKTKKNGRKFQKRLDRFGRIADIVTNDY